MKALVFVGLLAASPAFGQFVLETDNGTDQDGNTIQGNSQAVQLSTRAKKVTREFRTRAASAPLVDLKALDKLAGTSRDLSLEVGETVAFGYLSIQVQECRYPADNPTGDAFANLVIKENKTDGEVFNGWMVASSPALNAMDHPRYDVWVVRCKLDRRKPQVIAGESSPRPLMRPVALAGN